jgi:hypothetical protein
MAGAPRREQMVDDRNGMGRGHADRFVENEPAVNIALLSLGAGGLRNARIPVRTTSDWSDLRIHYW